MCYHMCGFLSHVVKVHRRLAAEVLVVEPGSRNVEGQDCDEVCRMPLAYLGVATQASAKGGDKNSRFTQIF